MRKATLWSIIVGVPLASILLAIGDFDERFLGLSPFEYSLVELVWEFPVHPILVGIGVATLVVGIEWLLSHRPQHQKTPGV